MSAPDELVSPVSAECPKFIISTAPINDQPAELDSTPASTETQRALRRRSRDDALRGMSPEEHEKRALVLTKRKSDPAVMVDIPQTPGAEELEKSGAIADEAIDEISTNPIKS